MMVAMRAVMMEEMIHTDVTSVAAAYTKWRIDKFVRMNVSKIFKTVSNQKSEDKLMTKKGKSSKA